MFKLILTLLAGMTFVVAPVQENTNIQNTNEPEIVMIRRARNGETGEWEEEVFHYEDEEGQLTVTLLDEQRYSLAIVSGEDSATISGKYTREGAKLTLFIGDEVFLKFNILADNSLEKIVEEPAEEGEEEDNPYAHMTLNELIEALRGELKKDQIDINTVGKIMLAILGVFAGSIIGLLIAIIRLKMRGAKREEIIEAIEKKAAEDMAKYQDQVKALINDLLVKVEKKIDSTEEQRKKEAEAQNLKLKASIEQARKNLTITDVLDKE